MLDIDELTGTIDSTFIPFASRKLYTIPVDITGCESTTEIMERMRAETAGKGYPEKSLIKYELVGKIVKRILTFCYISSATFFIL